MNCFSISILSFLYFFPDHGQYKYPLSLPPGRCRFFRTTKLLQTNQMRNYRRSSIESYEGIAHTEIHISSKYFDWEEHYVKNDAYRILQVEQTRRDRWNKMISDPHRSRLQTRNFAPVEQQVDPAGGPNRKSKSSSSNTIQGGRFSPPVAALVMLPRLIH